MTSDAPTPICLVVEAPATADDVARAAAVLGLVLDGHRGRVPVVLIVPPSGSLLDARIAPLVGAAQTRGAAALVAGDARLARTLRADGVHLTPGADPMAAYAEARDILGTRYIVGADAGSSRHDAMSLGEAGCDYVAFGRADGIPGAGADADAGQCDLVAWWSEIFEVPCVALAAGDAGEAAALAAAGADFVALPLPPSLAPDAAVRWIDGLAAALDGAAGAQASAPAAVS